MLPGCLQRESISLLKAEYNTYFCFLSVSFCCCKIYIKNKFSNIAEISISRLGPLAGPTAGAMAMVGTSHTVKKAVSSKAIEFLYGSKGDMSRRKNLKRTARNKRESR